MDKKEFVKMLVLATQKGGLITEKHDPVNANKPGTTYRSVIISDIAHNLLGFIGSGCFTVSHYQNSVYQSDYYVMTPTVESGFSVPASGIRALDDHPTEKLDRIIAVSGVKQGLHIYGEDSQRIEEKLKNKELTLLEELL